MVVPHRAFKLLLELDHQSVTDKENAITGVTLNTTSQKPNGGIQFFGPSVVVNKM